MQESWRGGLGECYYQPQGRAKKHDRKWKAMNIRVALRVAFRFSAGSKPMNIIKRFNGGEIQQQRIEELEALVRGQLA